MAGEVQKYQVSQWLTEGEIKSVGGKRWTMAHGKMLLGLAAVAVVFMFGFNYFIKPNVITQLVSAVPAIVLLFFWMQKQSSEGQKFWDSIPDKEKPIDLG